MRPAGSIDLVTIVVAVDYGQLFRRHNSQQVLRSKTVIISCSALFLGDAAAEAGHLRYRTGLYVHTGPGDRLSVDARSDCFIITSMAHTIRRTDGLMESCLTGRPSRRSAIPGRISSVGRRLDGLRCRLFPISVRGKLRQADEYQQACFQLPLSRSSVVNSFPARPCRGSLISLCFSLLFHWRPVVKV